MYVYLKWTVFKTRVERRKKKEKQQERIDLFVESKCWDAFLCTSFSTNIFFHHPCFCAGILFVVSDESSVAAGWWYWNSKNSEHAKLFEKFKCRSKCKMFYSHKWLFSLCLCVLIFVCCAFTLSSSRSFSLSLNKCVCVYFDPHSEYSAWIKTFTHSFECVVMWWPLWVPFRILNSISYAERGEERARVTKKTHKTTNQLLIFSSPNKLSSHAQHHHYMLNMPLNHQRRNEPKTYLDRR